MKTVELDHLRLYTNELEYYRKSSKYHSKLSLLDPNEMKQQHSGMTDNTLRVARLSDRGSSNKRLHPHFAKHPHFATTYSIEPSLPDQSTQIIGRVSSSSYRKRHDIWPPSGVWP